MPPATPPPATPVTTARAVPKASEPWPLAALPKPAYEPAPVSILGFPAATATRATTARAPLPYPTEDKIRDFIHAYRKAYESLDINRFRLFFAADAMEQNRPISTALPVYQQNFEALAALERWMETDPRFQK